MKCIKSLLILLFIAAPIMAEQLPQTSDTPQAEKIENKPKYAKGIAKIAGGTAFLLFGLYQMPCCPIKTNFLGSSLSSLKDEYNKGLYTQTVVSNSQKMSLRIFPRGKHALIVGAWLSVAGYAIYDGLKDIHAIEKLKERVEHLKKRIKQ